MCKAVQSSLQGGGAYHLSRAPSSRDQRRPKWPRISQNGSKFMTLINHKFRPFPPKTQKFRPMDRKACKGQKFTSIRVQRYILLSHCYHPPLYQFILCSSNFGMHRECADLRSNFIILSISTCPCLISPCQCVCTCLHPLHPQRSWLLLRTLASIFDHLRWPLEAHSDHNCHEHVVADTPSSLV